MNRERKEKRAKSKGAEAPSPALRALVLLFSFLFALFSGTASALTPDRDEPVHINARVVDINQKTGAVVYHGAVAIRQGRMRIDADRVEVRTRANKPQTARITGNPAVLRRDDDSFSALVIDYDFIQKSFSAAADANRRVHAVIQPRPKPPRDGHRNP